MTVTAKLAPATYPTPQQCRSRLSEHLRSSTCLCSNPSVWIVQGATLTLPLNARVLSNGRPVSGTTVNYQVTAGAGTLSSAAAQTDANGKVSEPAGEFFVCPPSGTVCVASGNSSCQVFNATVVPVSSLQVRCGRRNSADCSIGSSFSACNWSGLEGSLRLGKITACPVAKFRFSRPDDWLFWLRRQRT